MKIFEEFEEMFEGEIRDGLIQFTITYHAYGVSTTDLNAALTAFKIGLEEARDRSKNKDGRRRSILIRQFTEGIKQVEESIKIAEAEAKKEHKKQKKLRIKAKGKSKKGENPKPEELEDEKEEERDKEKGAEKEDKVRTLDTVEQGVKKKSLDLSIPEKSDVGDGSCSSSALKKNAIEPEQNS